MHCTYRLLSYQAADAAAAQYHIQYKTMHLAQRSLTDGCAQRSAVVHNEAPRCINCIYKGMCCVMQHMWPERKHVVELWSCFPAFVTPNPFWPRIFHI